MKSLLITASLLFAATHAVADSILIDSFTDGSNVTVSNSSGTASYNYLSGASDIIGGSRQIRTRAGGSGYYGSSNVAIDTTAGTLTSFGGDTGDRTVQYGTGIGANTFTGAGPGVPVQLNLNLNLADAFEFDVAAIGVSAVVQITVWNNGNYYNSNFVSIGSVGTYSVNLSTFSDLTEALADDIDGITFNFMAGGSSIGEGLVVSEVRIATAAVPEPSSFAAIAGLGVLGLAASRRRRAA